jgi:hypothetical protein
MDEGRNNASESSISDMQEDFNPKSLAERRVGTMAEDV